MTIMSKIKFAGKVADGALLKGVLHKLFWAERGCLSRSMLDQSRDLEFCAVIRQSGQLRVGHPRSFPLDNAPLSVSC
jgi:hypothetical protein